MAVLLVDLLVAAVVLLLGIVVVLVHDDSPLAHIELCQLLLVLVGAIRVQLVEEVVLTPAVDYLLADLLKLT